MPTYDVALVAKTVMLVAITFATVFVTFTNLHRAPRASVVHERMFMPQGVNLSVSAAAVAAASEAQSYASILSAPMVFAPALVYKRVSFQTGQSIVDPCWPLGEYTDGRCFIPSQDMFLDQSVTASSCVPNQTVSIAQTIGVDAAIRQYTVVLPTPLTVSPGDLVRVRVTGTNYPDVAQGGGLQLWSINNASFVDGAPLFWQAASLAPAQHDLILRFTMDIDVVISDMEFIVVVSGDTDDTWTIDSVATIVPSVLCAIDADVQLVDTSQFVPTSALQTVTTDCIIYYPGSVCTAPVFPSGAYQTTTLVFMDVIRHDCRADDETCTPDSFIGIATDTNFTSLVLQPFQRQTAALLLTPALSPMSIYCNASCRVTIVTWTVETNASLVVLIPDSLLYTVGGSAPVEFIQPASSPLLSPVQYTFLGTKRAVCYPSLADPDCATPIDTPDLFSLGVSELPQEIDVLATSVVPPTSFLAISSGVDTPHYVAAPVPSFFFFPAGSILSIVSRFRTDVRFNVFMFLELPPPHTFAATTTNRTAVLS